VLILPGIKQGKNKWLACTSSPGVKAEARSRADSFSWHLGQLLDRLRGRGRADPKGLELQARLVTTSQSSFPETQFHSSLSSFWKGTEGAPRGDALKCLVVHT
jgi:hypothetical protein